MFKKENPYCFIWSWVAAWGSVILITCWYICLGAFQNLSIVVKLGALTYLEHSLAECFFERHFMQTCALLQVQTLKSKKPAIVPRRRTEMIANGISQRAFFLCPACFALNNICNVQATHSGLAAIQFIRKNLVCD